MKSGKIFSAFPTPKFLDIPFAGISIGDSLIHCVQFRKKSGRLYLEKYKEVIIPSGVVSSGQINNVDALADLLLGLKKELGLQHVKISLPEEKAYLFNSRIPVVSRDEIMSVVESKIEDSVPVPPNELVFDYNLIDHRAEGHLDIVVSALPVRVVDTYAELVAKSGLELLALEIESQAIARALLPEGDTGTVLLVNFGKDKAGLYVATDRIVRFTSTVPLRPEPEDDLPVLSQEIQKLYTYWHTLKENVGRPEKKISRVIICGENVSEETLPYITAHNGAETVFGNVWVNAFDIHKTVPVIPFAESQKYATAVGLALPSPILI